MGQQQSKGELLYEQAVNGNLDNIKSLCTEGAGLEWIDKEGKTPLIVACMTPDLFVVAKTLIELGANVNAYRPGRHAGTPLHHAAKRGLEQTVKLLLSHGANALLMNDDCQTPLDLARKKGYNNAVRAIENHICYFSGWVREFYGLGFLDALAPQLLSRKIWAVVLPVGSPNRTNLLKMELILYATSQHAQPRTVIALWKTKIEEPKFHQSDPALIITDKSTKARYKLASANVSDKQQLRWLYSACCGIPQGQGPIPPTTIQPAVPTISQASNTNGWDEHSAGDSSHGGWGPSSGPPPSKASTSGWMDEPSNGRVPSGEPTPSKASTSGWIDEPSSNENNGWGVPESTPSGNPAQPVLTPVSSAPSAPPIPYDNFDGPIHYPSIDFSPVEMSGPDLPGPMAEPGVCGASEVKDGDNSSSCVICWEAPIEGACIPCGHMAGCISCLSEIKAKKGVCPVCRAKIDQVVRLYAV